MFAYGGTWNGFQWWWLIPIAMMVLCFLRMRGRHHSSESAREVLDKRYALGEISREEYEEKKRDMSRL